MKQAFVNGFLKTAQDQGCTLGEAWDIFKMAVANGSFSTPSFAPTQPINPNPPIVDTVKPSSLFPISGGNPGSTGGLGGSGGLSSLGTGAGSGSLGSGQQQNFGFNINQTGLGGVNNSVTSAPPSTINSVLNKPVTPTASPMV